jgi:hypothetical protein
LETWSGLNALNVSLSGWLCSCIEWEVQNTWMALNEVVGGIYSSQPLPSHWLFLLAMGTPDSLVAHQTLHCSLSGARHVSYPLGFGAVDRCVFCLQAAPDSPVAHQTCLVCSNFSALTSAWHCSSLFICAVDR